ncbi:hypothetical protein SAMN04487851_11483 [Prevotella sp. tc2-28]|uniref:hypothetical protein n=1 Tax=Prevotella sp. tc2-28 TaxID=1761888 RepID=UPI00089673ED|nr:hypothetical protein [Prevotella sp. tc2-28]SEA80212.1 hypothetical protein SAMN04487851_11483 [Prevotella sp. tc2-28]
MNNGFIFKNGSIKRMPMENEVVSASGTSEEQKKVCPGCGRELPLSAFNKHPRSADGHMKECKECTRRRLHSSKKSAKSNPLAQFTARELMKELKTRGYEGILEYTTVQRINISDM